MAVQRGAAFERPSGSPVSTPGEVAARAYLYERVERSLDLPMLVLSLALVPLLVVPVVEPHLAPSVRSWFDVGDYVVWACFALEYGLLLALAPDRWHFVRTHVPDLLLVAVPILRPLRIVRTARALRLDRLVRTGASVASASGRSRHRLAARTAAWAGLVTAGLVLVGSLVELDLERGAPHATITSFGDALWWAIATVTSVGYGDLFPVTPAGRAAATLLMVAGVGLLGTVTASLAAWLVRAEERTGPEAELRAEVAALASLVGELRDRLARLGGEGAGLRSAVAEPETTVTGEASARSGEQVAGGTGAREEW